MKNTIRIFFSLLLITIVGSVMSSEVQTDAQKIDTTVARVTQEMSLLDQIMEQAEKVVYSEDQKSRKQAKQELVKLMNDKALDAEIKKSIQKDIEIIKKTTDKTEQESYDAYDRLVKIAQEIDVKANVVETIAEATKMVENASPENLQETITQANKKIEEAQEEEQSMMGRLYAGAKRIVTVPVNYVFGEESSRAKTAFYAAVGMTILAAGMYGVYQSNLRSSLELINLEISWMEKAISEINTYINFYNYNYQEANLTAILERTRDKEAREAKKIVAEREAKEILEKISYLRNKIYGFEQSLLKKGVNVTPLVKIEYLDLE